MSGSSMSCVCGGTFRHHLAGYRRCGRCRLWSRLPQPSDARLAEIYGAGYYTSWGEHGDAHAEYPTYWTLKYNLFRHLLDRAGVRPGRGRALDVGCATGACLSVLGELGYTAHGVDINVHAVEIARRLVPQAVVHMGSLETVGLEPNSFNLCVLSDVIEHLRDPWAFMRGLHGFLRPGGRVVILTPDVGSLSAAMMRGAWPHIKEEHLYLFSRSSLIRLVHDCGLKLVRVSAASKPLSIDYAVRQFDTYNHPLISPAMRALHRAVPHGLAQRPVPVRMGEMLLVAERIS